MANMAYEVWGKALGKDGRERLSGKHYESDSYDKAARYTHIESCRIREPLYLLDTGSGKVVMFDVYGCEHFIGYSDSRHRIRR